MSFSKSYWRGERVYLRAYEADDRAVLLEHWQDSEPERFTHHIEVPMAVGRPQPADRGTHAHDAQEFELLICNRADEIVGTINTTRANPRIGKFSYGITIFAPHRRKGYAAEAIRIVLRYYFEELRYQKCNVTAYSINEPSIALHLSLGFREEGRLRRSGFSNGRFHDDVLLGITYEEFATTNP